MLRDDLRRPGWGSGREARKEGDVFIHIADSFCCPAETSTTQHCKAIIKKKKRTRDCALCWWFSYALCHWILFFFFLSLDSFGTLQGGYVSYCEIICNDRPHLIQLL